MVVLLVFLIILLSEAYYEALRYAKKDATRSGIAEAFHRSIVYLFVIFYLSDIYVPWLQNSGFTVWQLIGLFLLLRFGIFRGAYNLFAGKSYMDRGSKTKVYDKVFWTLIDWTRQPPGILVPTLEFLATFTAIVLLIWK